MSSKIKNLLIVLIILLAIVNAGLVYFVQIKKIATVKKYYAVHLDNSQVIIGNPEKVTDETIVLGNVYYLENTTANIDAALKKVSLSSSPNFPYILVKRGSGEFLPTNGKLYINRSSVLYWEELNRDSELVKKIQ